MGSLSAVQGIEGFDASLDLDDVGVDLATELATPTTPTNPPLHQQSHSPPPVMTQSYEMARPSWNHQQASSLRSSTSYELPPQTPTVVTHLEHSPRRVVSTHQHVPSRSHRTNTSDRSASYVEVQPSPQYSHQPQPQQQQHQQQQ